MPLYHHGIFMPINSLTLFTNKKVHRPYSKSKLELNSKKLNSIDTKTFVCVSIFFALKAKFQVFEFEFVRWVVLHYFSNKFSKIAKR